MGLFRPGLGSPIRGCTLGAYTNYNFNKDRESLILGIWAAPGVSRGPPEPPGPGSKNLKTHTFCSALLSGRVRVFTQVGSAGPPSEGPLDQRRADYSHTLCYAIVLPGRKSVFRAGFRPDSSRESLNIGPPAGLRPAGGLMLKLFRLEFGRNPARKTGFRPGSIIA